MIVSIITNYECKVAKYECKEYIILSFTQQFALITMASKSKSGTERCTALKDVFEGLQSFEFIGIRQTNSADELVLSWNGSEKFNANSTTSYIKTFIKQSKLTLPKNRS